jgi:predicted ester cyclase
MLHLISQDIKAIARRTLGEIFPRGDVAALAEVVHANFVDHDGPPGAPQGLEGMAWSLRMLQAAFSDRRWEIHEVIAEDDTVVLYCTFHGRHTWEFMGLAPTSRSLRMPWPSCCRTCTRNLPLKLRRGTSARAARKLDHPRPTREERNDL